MKEKKIGFTIGKFAPLHKGHEYLIETALKEMDNVIVIVYETNLTKVPTEVRAGWIKKMYPRVKVKVAINPPSQYGLDEKSVEMQMEYLKQYIKDIKPTHFYSSEPYGEYVATYLNIVDRRVDDTREKISISAGIVREDLEKNKKWIEQFVYEDLKKYENKK